MAKTSKRTRILSKTKQTFSKLYGRKLSDEEESEIGKNLVRLGRALAPLKKSKKRRNR